MASSLPCPNPACKHVFAVTEVQGASVLTCPRCSWVFRFRAGQGTSAQAVMPGASPLPLPMAKTASSIDVELLSPVNGRVGMPGPMAVPASGSIVPASVVQRHRQQASGRWLSLIMAVMVAVIAIGMVLAGYFTFRASPPDEKRPSTGPRFSAGPRPTSVPPSLPINGPGTTAVADSVVDNNVAPTVKTGQNSPMENVVQSESFHGERTELELPAGVWTKYKATDEDEQGDLFLMGRDPKGKDNNNSATILVVVLDKSEGDLPSVTKMVRDRIEMQRQAENKDFRLVPASEGQPPESEAVGDRRGQVVELKGHVGAEPRKYLLLAVVQLSDATYAIRCESKWEYRQVWQSAFRDLLKSFRLRTKE